MTTYKFFLTSFLLLTFHSLLASIISGTVSNENGEKLPYATLYIEGSSEGTTTNSNGNYSLSVKQGTYSIIFQYVGYKKLKKVVTISNTDLTLHVILQSETFKLQEVVVNSDQEDPAYSIIRNAIKNRKKHRDEINAYTCKVYVKGLQRLDNKPNRILGYNVPVDTGIVYLSESISELSYRVPDQIHERMISSKVSGNNSGFSFNQASQTLLSVYDNLITVEGLTERGYVSPLASNALFFYTYQLIGTITENDLLINKIKVTPKRKTDPTFSGYLYIIEDQWRVSSLDLTLSKEHQLEFLDEISVHQVFAPIGDKSWVMISQHFDFNLKAFGFAGSGYFAIVYSDYKIELNPKYHTITQTSADSSILTTTNDPEILRESKNKKNEVLLIEDGANEKTDSYWAQHRPVPLTAIESQDYQYKDSLTKFMKTEIHQDSIDKINNKINAEKILYAGYTYRNSYQDYSYSINSLINSLQYNTVEGTVINLSGNYSTYHNDKLVHQLTPQIRYGFASQDMYAQLGYRWRYNPMKFSRFELVGGHFISQFNYERPPILPVINSLETLINRRNYMKLYEKSFLAIKWQSEIVNGMFIRTKINYERRNPLSNQTDYSFFYQDSRTLTSNTPSNIEYQDVFTSHEALTLDLSTTLRFGQKYITRPDLKYNLGSKYPEVTFAFQTGLPVFNSEISYSEIELKISDKFKIGLLGEGEFILASGTFLNSTKLQLIDYKHFQSNQSIYSAFDLDQYQLLDYYLYSTSGPWLQGHYSHHFNGFIVNKLPLIKKTKVQAIASFHYLNTKYLDHYIELGFGIEHIFKLGRLDYTLGILDGDYLNGFRFGFGF
ncbi:MAG: DUF5686 and carboxypeptidase regulatory-like domain-containing protein [Reichenbachiella sp.]